MFVQSTKQWHNWSFELEMKLIWKRSTALCDGPTSQHSEKAGEMMVNLGVNGCTKTPNQQKIFQKTQKDDTVLKPY